jgi:hypothetical protein
MNGVDDLVVNDALEVYGRDSQVSVSELALDDDEQDAFAGHLNRVGVSELMRRKATSHTCGCCCASKLASH